MMQIPAGTLLQSVVPSAERREVAAAGDAGTPRHGVVEIAAMRGPIAGWEHARRVPLFDLTTQTGRWPVARPPVPLVISLAERIPLRGEPPDHLPHRKIDRAGQLSTADTCTQMPKPPLKHRDHTRHTRTEHVVHGARTRTGGGPKRHGRCRTPSRPAHDVTHPLNPTVTLGGLRIGSKAIGLLGQTPNHGQERATRLGRRVTSNGGRQTCR